MSSSSPSSPARGPNGRDHLVWMDLEMTGLNPERERIIELAVLVTDADLTVVAEGPELVLHQDDTLLARMDEWNTSHHGASGLTERVRNSTVTEASAEAAVLDFLREWCDEGSAPLCGNSIWQDRRFIALYMPVLDEFLHYRMIDVSSVKELVRRWAPDVLAAAPEKRGAHRALGDIRESIAELRYYRARAFAPELR